MADDNVFSLDKLEFLSYSRQYEPAAREVIKLLSSLDASYGTYQPAQGTRLLSSLLRSEEHESHLIARITSALSCLFSDPNFDISPQGFAQIISWQRWIAALFAASPFRNADHVIRALNLLGHGTDELQLNDKTVIKFCLLFSPESEIPVDLDALWRYNKNLTACLACVLMSPRFIGTPAAHSKRELLLRWFPEKLAEIEDLTTLPMGILHDVYMHCSYADLPEKHAIKKPINNLVRKKMLGQGLADVQRIGLIDRSKKPVMLIVLEWFSGAHSIYRTHSTTMRAARELFHVVAMGYAHKVDQLGRAVFDEFIEINEATAFNGLAHVRSVAQERQPAVFYMPSVGMFPITIFATNLRLAPVQAYALGHPATTHSPYMDYVVVEEDYVGDPACFSEKLMMLPKDGIPYVPSAENKVIEPILRETPETVRIAVASTTMKLNPSFLSTLREIGNAAKTPVEFHFMMGFAHGLMYTQVKNLIAAYLPTAVVHTHQPYASYMACINNCDMFVNPFPFGNTNGIIDVVTLGQVGVCKTGREVNEHIDEGLFRRLSVPEWLIAKTNEEYVKAAVTLIDDHQLRLKLRRELIQKKGVDILFKGRPEIFGQRLLAYAKEAKAV